MGKKKTVPSSPPSPARRRLSLSPGAGRPFGRKMSAPRPVGRAAAREMPGGSPGISGSVVPRYCRRHGDERSIIRECRSFFAAAAAEEVITGVIGHESGEGMDREIVRRAV